MPAFPVLDDGANPVPLTFFGMNELNDVRSLTQYRSVYSPLARSRGDGQPEPTSIVFEGLVYGKTMQEMFTKRAAIFAAANRGEQWLKFIENGIYFDNAIRIGTVVNRNSSPADTREMRAMRVTLEFGLLAPFWQSLTEKSETLDIVNLTGNIELNNVGDRTSYPIIELIDAEGVTEVSVSISGRTLRWVTTSPLEPLSTFLIDTLRGQVYLDGASDIAHVADNSMFPELPPGAHTLTVNLVGGGGTITARYRDSWSL